MLIAYQAISILLAFLVGMVTLRANRLGLQITGGVVLILLILRILLIK